MAIERDDRTLTDAQGRALAGAQVYWCTQPATAPSVAPPSPLATIYGAITGGIAIAQPVITDGFGHAWAYMDDSVLYTIVMYHPLFGANPIVWPDQHLNGGGGGGGGNTVTVFEGIPQGAIDGTNRVFTLTNGGVPLVTNPSQAEVWLNFPLIPGLGYTLSGVTITYATAPQPASGGVAADSLYARGVTIS